MFSRCEASALLKILSIQFTVTLNMRHLNLVMKRKYLIAYSLNYILCVVLCLLLQKSKLHLSGGFVKLDFTMHAVSDKKTPLAMEKKEASS
jgi:hypothetical protein